MSFRQMTFQIFKANLRRYLLFFLCSSFTIMTFFTFATLSNNPGFNDPYQVSGMISGNVYAPTLVLKVFSVLFLIYAQSAFMKFRKSDYGLFMVLGMTNTNIRKMLLFENTIIAAASIVTGLSIGTVFARIFYGMVSMIVDLRNISFTLTMESYKDTVFFFGAIYVVVIATSLLLTLRYSIINLLKESRTADRGLIRGHVPGILGIVLIAFAAYDYLSYDIGDQGNLVFRSLGICLAGIYLVMSSLSDWMILALRYSPKKHHKSLLFISDLRHTFGQSKIVLFLITILVTFSLFLSSLVLFLSLETQNMATRQNPYHIAYTEVFGKNQISPKTLSSIVDNGRTPLTSHKVLEYIDLFQFKVFLDQNINTIAGTNYHVEQDHFLNFTLYDRSQGYQGELPEMATYKLEGSSGNRTLLSQGAIAEMLINRVPILSNGLIVILNQEDYTALKAANAKSIGHIHLLNFKNWKKTAEIDSSLNAALVKYNKENTKSWYAGNDRQEATLFRTQSRIQQYSELKQSNEFGVVLFVFDGLLFFISTGVLLHFRIWTDWEKEKLKFQKLNKIGITSKEVAKIIAKPFRLLFFLPYVLGTILSSFYFVFMTKLAVHQTIEPLRDSLFVGGIYLGLQLLLYLLYTRIYTKRILKEIGLKN